MNQLCEIWSEGAKEDVVKKKTKNESVSKFMWHVPLRTPIYKSNTYLQAN